MISKQAVILLKECVAHQRLAYACPALGLNLPFVLGEFWQVSPKFMKSKPLFRWWEIISDCFRCPALDLPHQLCFQELYKPSAEAHRKGIISAFEHSQSLWQCLRKRHTFKKKTLWRKRLKGSQNKGKNWTSISQFSSSDLNTGLLFLNFLFHKDIKKKKRD